MTYLAQVRLALVLCILTPAGTDAQKAWRAVLIDSGTVLRVTTVQERQPVTVQVLERFHANSESLHFCPSATLHCDGANPTASRTVMRDEIRTMEIRRGTRMVRGAVIGGVVIGGLATLAGAFASGCDTCGSGSPRRDDVAAAVFGTIAGGMIGSRFRHWEKPHRD